MKVQIIRDVPIGILLIVAAQFLVYGVMYLAKWPTLFELLGIVVLVILAEQVITFGVDLIRGIIIDDEEEIKK